MGEAPWALQLVARVEKAAPPTVDDLCVAAGVATVVLLDSAEALGWQTEVDRWLDGRIRKIVRRARGAPWARAQLLPGVTVARGTAEVRAFVPGPTDAVPADLSKLQVEGLVLEVRSADAAEPDDEPTDGVERGDVEPVEPIDDHPAVVAMNPRWALAAHPGKAAAQVAHAVQLVRASLDASAAEAWRDRGYPVRIEWPSPTRWAEIEAEAPVVIADAGYTVVEPGARTCAAWPP